MASSDTGEGTVSADNLSFFTTNWNADQTVTITGLRTIFPTATSPTRSVSGGTHDVGLGYKYVDPQDVTLKNLDTEMGGYYVSSVSGTRRI